MLKCFILGTQYQISTSNIIIKNDYLNHINIVYNICLKFPPYQSRERDTNLIYGLLK